MKKFLFLLIPLALTLACQAVNGRPSYSDSNSPVEPTRTVSDPAAPKGITIVRLRKQDGDLSMQLAAEASKAEALGQIPVVYFDASW